MLRGLKVALRMAHAFVSKAKCLVMLAEKGLNAIRDVVDVGLDVGKAIGNYTVNGLVNIHHLCFNTSLEKASSSCFSVKVNATFFGEKRVEFEADTCMDVSFINTIAKTIKTKLFPGVKLFKTGIEKAKALFTDMDDKRDELEDELSKEEKEKEHEMQDEKRRSQIVLTEEERDFQKV